MFQKKLIKIVIKMRHHHKKVIKEGEFDNFTWEGNRIVISKDSFVTCVISPRKWKEVQFFYDGYK